MYALSDFQGTRLKSSWNVLTGQDVENLVAIKEFLEISELIKAECTLDAKRYGEMIKRKNMAPFEKCINCEIARLKRCLGKSVSQATQKDTASSSLASLLTESRNALIKYLVAQAVNEDVCWKQLFANDKSLLRQMQNRKIQRDEAVKQAVETIVDHRLNFPKAQEMIRKPGGSLAE